MQRRRGLVLGAVVVAVAIVIASIVLAGGWWTDHPSPTPTPASVAAADMPVVSVADASALLASGALDGRAVAIRGFLAMLMPSCPAPMRESPQIESGCHAYMTLADAPFSMCRPFNGGIECGGDVASSVGPTLSPRTMRETSQHFGLAAAGGMGQAIAVVLVAHTRDPRYLQCSAEARAECERALIVDYLADANSATFEIEPPQSDVAIGITWAEAAAAAGAPPESVITAIAVRASEVADVDPRFNFIGNGVVWVIRWIGAAETDLPTRPVSVAVVEDATGAVLGQENLVISPDSQLARLSLEMARPDVGDGQRFAAFNVTGAQDKPIASGVISDSRLTERGFRRGYARSPVILEAGQYRVTVWFGSVNRPPDGKTSCSIDVSLAAHDDVGARALFPAAGRCDMVFVPPDQQ